MKAIVFDRDGVLARFDVRTAAARLEPLLPFGLAELEARLRAWHLANPGGDDAWPRFCRSLDVANIDALIAVDPMQLLVAYPDAHDALVTARAAGLRTAVLSNFALLDLQASLRHLGFDALVGVRRSATQLGAAKPDPRAYLGIAEALDLSPADCVLLDDRAEHVAGAEAVGMQAILVDRRAGAQSAFSATQACASSAVLALVRQSI